MILQVLSGIAVGIGSLAQFLDCYTTYQGVKIAGLGIDSNKSAFAKWLLRNPLALLTVKPLGFGAAGALLVYAGPATDGGSIFMAFAASIASSVLGFFNARQNAKINKNLAAQKAAGK